ncbi:hypothetical protein D3C83_32690 [compost metagenome]
MRFPYQRGFAPPSGRNMPMNTWFSFCERLVALIGKLAEANTELTDCTSIRIWRRASTMACSFFAWKYLPPPNLAMLDSRAVSSASCASLNTSMV